MLSLSICAVIIGMVITFAAQVLYSAQIVTADTRNLCLTAFGVWLTVAVMTYCGGLLILAGGV